MNNDNDEDGLDASRMLINDELDALDRESDSGKERLTQRTSFAGYLAGQLVQAVGSADHAVRWCDAVYAAGLAARLFAQMAVAVTKAESGHDMAPEDIKARINALLAQSEAAKINMMRVDSEAELDSMVHSMETGLH